ADAACAAGVERILYTSHQACSPSSLFAPMSVHAATEEHLAGLGTPFVSLRNGFYASTLGFYLPEALATGRFTVPDDGPVSWTAHADLAEAAAVALTRPEAFDGVTPPLVADRTWTFEQVAAELSAMLGREITRVVATDEQWRDAAVERGMPPQAADFTLGFFRAARRGEFDVVDPALPTVLDRPTTPLRTTLEAVGGLD
ncbi:SDR family NAD(P)-dependent oxidoreductase, partial [Actinoplanes octamycinicus]